MCGTRLRLATGPTQQRGALSAWALMGAFHFATKAAKRKEKKKQYRGALWFDIAMKESWKELRFSLITILPTLDLFFLRGALEG